RVSVGHSISHPLLFLWFPVTLLSALCPYTTLFRSRWSAACSSHSLPSVLGGGDATRQRAERSDVRGHQRVLGHDGDAGDRDALRDRKSTRLNSSHAKISYAVFCLTKKS